MDRPRSKSPATISGIFAARCIRLMKVAVSSGSAFAASRPSARFTRISPPTCSRDTRLLNFAASRERRNLWPLKGITTSCAILSRAVSDTIQRAAAASGETGAETTGALAGFGADLLEAAPEELPNKKEIAATTASFRTKIRVWRNHPFSRVRRRNLRAFLRGCPPTFALPASDEGSSL